MRKPLSQEMWDWNIMDGHIRPDEWKVQEWSRETKKLENCIAKLWNYIPESAQVNFEECSQEMFLMEFPECEEIIRNKKDS